MSGSGKISSRAGSVATVVVVSVLATAVYLAPIVDTPFYTKGEAREAVLVQAMVDSGNYILPLRNGQEIPSKPPLFHWLGVFASLALGGVSEFSTRLASVLAAVVVLAATMWLAGAMFDTAAALVAAALLATSVTFVVSATTARVDMVLTAAVTAALASFYCDYVGPRRGIPRLFHVFVAFAVLAKGPVGLVLPWGIVVSTLVVFRDREYVLRLGLARAATWLLLPALWYAAAFAVAGDEFVAKQLVRENFQRLVDAEGGGTGHVKPFYAHVPLLLGGLAPWSMMFVAACWYGIREVRSRPSKPLVFLLAWLLIPLALLSFAGSKRPVYMLPSYPACSLLIAWWWTQPQGWTADSIAKAARAWRAVAIATSLGLALPIAALIVQGAGLPIDRVIVALMSKGDAANLHAVVASLGSIRGVLLCVSLVTLGLVAVFAVAALSERRVTAAVAAGLLGTIAIAGGSVSLQRSIAQTQTVKLFVERLASNADAGAEWAFFRGVDYPVAFYARRPVPQIEAPTDLDPGRPALVFAPGERAADLMTLSGAIGRDAQEVGRFTFGDNQKRDHLVAVSIAASSEVPSDAR